MCRFSAMFRGERGRRTDPKSLLAFVGPWKGRPKPERRTLKRKGAIDSGVVHQQCNRIWNYPDSGLMKTVRLGGEYET